MAYDSEITATALPPVLGGPSSESALALYSLARTTGTARAYQVAADALAAALATERALARAGLNVRRLVQAREVVAPPAAPKARAKASRKAQGLQAAPVYTLEASSLAKALRFLCKAVPRPNRIPVLAMARLEACGDFLRITTTNLDAEITVHVQAPGIGHWRVLAPALDLLAIVAKAPKGCAVRLAGELGAMRPPAKGEPTDDHRESILHVHAPGERTLKGLPRADFPKMTFTTESQGAARVPVSANDLGAGLAFVRPCMSDEATRYYLNGAFVHGGSTPAGPFLRLVATDGHRLAKVDLPAPAQAFDASAIIPRESVGWFVDAMCEGAEIALAGAERVQLAAGPVVITSRLIQGSFPDYSRVIPADLPAAVTVDRAAFAGALTSAAAVFDRSGSKTRTVSLQIEAGEIRAECAALDGGAKAAERVPCDFEGEPFAVGFNSTLLRQALERFAGDRVTLACGSPWRGGAVADPVLITDGDPARLVVLMPLRP